MRFSFIGFIGTMVAGAMSAVMDRSLKLPKCLTNRFGMQRKWSTFIAILVVALGLSSCAAVRETASDDAGVRVALAAKAFPEQKKFLYIDVPAANNGASNLMMRAFVGEAAWMQQLTSSMARGASTPTYLVVGSRDDGVAYSAVKKALADFKGKQLSQLHLGLIGDSHQAEQLRSMTDALGSEYLVLPSASR